MQDYRASLSVTHVMIDQRMMKSFPFKTSFTECMYNLIFYIAVLLCAHLFYTRRI